MTGAELLYIILLIVGVVVGVLLAINLVRVNDILSNFQESSRIVNSRISDIDKKMGNLEDFLSKAPSFAKSFLLSIDFFKLVTDKLKDYSIKQKSKDNKGEDDKE